MSIPVIFLDRDGVINKEVNYLSRIEDFVFIDGAIDSIKYLLGIGYEIIVITNQSGIARGLYTLEDYHVINSWMLNEFKRADINILDVFFCPHGPEDDCSCRKPKPGMILDARKKYDIDLSNSWLVGDKEDDIACAISAGIRNTVLVKSGHPISIESSNAKYIKESLAEVKEVIKTNLN